MTPTTLPLGLADQSLSAKIYEELRERIIEGIIPAGERIRERELAEEFNVSRIPIREAMPRLESEGFIRTVPRRGAIVTEMTLRDVEELFQVRSSLEVLAARLAAEACASGVSGERLTELVLAADAATKSADDRGIAAANSALHEEILVLSSNALLISLMGPINGRVRRLFRLEAERDQLVLCAEHRDLCKAIVDGKAELAASLAYAHVEHSRADSLELLGKTLPHETSAD